MLIWSFLRKNKKKFKTLFIITLISFCGLMLCLSFLITYFVVRSINNSWTWLSCDYCNPQDSSNKITIRVDVNKTSDELLQYNIEDGK